MKNSNSFIAISTILTSYITIEYYVSVNGDTNGNGTPESPLTFECAIQKHLNF